MKKTIFAVGLALACMAAGAADYYVLVPFSGKAASLCELPWGGSLKSGEMTIAFRDSEVPFGSTCESETRACTSGKLLGTYTNRSCVSALSNTTWNLASLSAWPVANPYTCIRVSADNLTLAEKEGCATSWQSARSTTKHTSGKWYLEYRVSSVNYNDLVLGIIEEGGVTSYDDGKRYPYLKSNTANNIGGASLSYGSGDLISFAVDLDTNKIWVAKNCAWVGGSSPSAGTGPYVSAAARSGPVYASWANEGRGTTWGSPDSNVTTANFGGKPFDCTVPEGFTPGF